MDCGRLQDNQLICHFHRLNHFTVIFHIPIEISPGQNQHNGSAGVLFLKRHNRLVAAIGMQGD